MTSHYGARATMTSAQNITVTLGGRWHGGYGLAFCPAHENTRTPALSLADGADGRLLAKCHAGCDFPSIAAALRARGLLPGPTGSNPPAPVESAIRLAEEKARAVKRERQARATWEEAQPAFGTLAERYLRARAITAELPSTLRFHPACWHLSAKRMPALVALVQGTDAFAIHRTYLRADGLAKADVEPGRAMLGACKGGAVRLSSGPGPLVVAEGVETAMSLLSGLLPRPAAVWASLSTSGMVGLRLPARSGELVVAADGDPEGITAAQALAERARRSGWRVDILPAPEGSDWNDVLMEGAHDAH